MTSTEKKQILETYKQQLSAIKSQVNFATQMVEHYSSVLSRFAYDSYVDSELANVCRSYLKFFELRDRLSSQLTEISSELDVISCLK